MLLDEIIDATTNCVNQLNGNNIESANDFLHSIKESSSIHYSNHNQLKVRPLQLSKNMMRVIEEPAFKEKELRDVTKSIKNALNLIISTENESGAMDENSTAEKKLERFLKRSKTEEE